MNDSHLLLEMERLAFIVYPHLTVQHQHHQKQQQNQTAAVAATTQWIGSKQMQYYAEMVNVYQSLLVEANKN